MTDPANSFPGPQRGNTQMTDLEARQHELESEMSALGTARFRREIAEARQQGSEAQTPYGHKLIAAGVSGVADAITETLRVAGMKNGRQPVFLMYLRLLDADTLAFIGTKGVIEGITRRRRLQSVAVRIGRVVEDEVRFQAFARAEHTKDGETKPLDAYVDVVVTQLNRQTSDYDHKRAVLIHSMTKMGVEWDNWPEAHVAHLGLKLIDLVITATGVAQVVTICNRRKSEDYLSATPETTAWIDGKVTWDEVMCPIFQPMVVPPRDWTGPTGGGYLRPWPGAAKLVKTRNPAYLEEIAALDQTFVLNTLNAVQRTPWKINTEILDVMVALWRTTSLTFGKLPPRDDEPKPPKPEDIATNEAAKKAWKRAASNTLAANLKLSSKRLMVESILRTATKFAGYGAIYFPHNLDFRGRVYPIPAGLNPQGYDVAKGLLAFAVGKPLGTQLAADWLAIHGANLWGFDKVSLKERVQWVKANERDIIASADAPLDNLWWLGADDGKKALQFLAFCFEWRGYLAAGLDFVSHQPIALDGSCNGLQHFSAMLRDPIGGAAVNLVPALKPNDIYQTVCDKTTERLKADGSLLAHQWLTFGLTRKGTKRSVMVVPYGGTRHSSRDYLKEHVEERIRDNHEPNPWPEKDGVGRACNFLSNHLWDAIRDTVVAARDAMDWLQKVARIVSKDDKPLNWTAPSGFRVQQAYQNTKDREIETLIAGKVIQLRLSEDAPTLDKRRQAQGISPNFVHSLDAAALAFTVDAAVACGIEAFAMIHDSYGTLAADTDTLRECLRQAFCSMYQFDVLQAFADEIQKGLPEGVTLPPVPKKGTLDISLVLKSDFFFA